MFSDHITVLPSGPHILPPVPSAPGTESRYSGSYPDQWPASDFQLQDISYGFLPIALLPPQTPVRTLSYW